MRKFYRGLMSSIVLMVMFVLGMSSAFAIPDAPPSVIPVVDETGSFDAQSLMRIGKTANIDNSDVKVYTYIVPQLPEEYANIDEAARETLNAWGLSENGVLIYIVKADGKISVQVGERWKEALSNDMERIISETIVPSLSEDNYTDALTNGISEIKQAASSDSPSAINKAQTWLLSIAAILAVVLLVYLSTSFIVKLLQKNPSSDTQTISSTTSTNETFTRTVPQRESKDTKEKMRNDIEELQLSNPTMFYAVLDEIEKENHNDNDGMNSSIEEHTNNYNSDSDNYSSSSYKNGSGTDNTYSSVYDSSSYNSYSSSYNFDFGSSYGSSYSSDFGSSDNGGSFD